MDKLVTLAGNIVTSVCTKPIANLGNQGAKVINSSSADSFSSSPLTIINKLLKSVYGINSEIRDLRIAKKVQECVENFCSVNKNDKLFNGLSLSSSKEIDSVSTISERTWYYAQKKFNLDFNENFDWDNLDKITQQAFDNCLIPSDNPLCFLYKDFGNFLNFKYNPAGYHVASSRIIIDDSAKIARRIGESIDTNEFNSNYIAGRMCGILYPQKIYAMFSDYGNTDLRFPKPLPLKLKTGSVHKFKSIEEGVKYLAEKYSINAEFMNTEQANYMAEAADDLSKALGNNDFFRGLKILRDIENSPNTHMFIKYNSDTKKADLIINEAFNWKKWIQLCDDNYQNGYNPSPRRKDPFIHELVHYLDFMGNPRNYADTNYKFSKNIESFTNTGISRSCKVSEYAAKSPAEFCAEYVAGRMAGIEYPKAVNEMFTEYWNGPALNFNY